MKTNIYLLVFLVFSVILLSMVAPFTAMATVVGSPHDFSTGGTSGFQSTNEDEVCIFCHTPHGGLATDPAGTVVKLPLWNRTLNYGSSFTMYDSGTFNGKSSYISNKPTGMSLMCLSCHDGVTTINAVLNYGPDGPILIPGGSDQIGDFSYPPWRNPNIGSDLSNDHPVSFVYDDALVTADTASRGGVPGLNDPDVVTYPGNSSEKLILYGSATDATTRRIECSTCHDPHEWGDATGQMPFLRMSNANSGMCTKCHIK